MPNGDSLIVNAESADKAFQQAAKADYLQFKPEEFKKLSEIQWTASSDNATGFYEETILVENEVE